MHWVARPGQAHFFFPGITFATPPEQVIDVSMRISMLDVLLITTFMQSRYRLRAHPAPV